MYLGIRDRSTRRLTDSRLQTKIHEAPLCHSYSEEQEQLEAIHLDDRWDDDQPANKRMKWSMAWDDEDDDDLSGWS